MKPKSVDLGIVRSYSYSYYYCYDYYSTIAITLTMIMIFKSFSQAGATCLPDRESRQVSYMEFHFRWARECFSGF